MRSNSRAVSSMRVPGWARTCIRICPESTAGKKFSPRNGQRPKETTTQARNSGDENLRRGKRERQQRAIASAHLREAIVEHLLKAFERVARSARRRGGIVSGMMAAHEIVGHGRNQRARQQERADQSKGNGLGQRPEQVAGDAAELEHRHEDDTQAKQRHEGRDDDLLGAVHDRRLDWFAHFQMVVDVLDGDSSIIDENADGKRQSAQRHDVDGLAEPRQQRQREQYGERNLDQDDDRRTPAAEEYQDHQPDQRGGERRLADDAENGGLDED